jgi:hypothetical protein
MPDETERSTQTFYPSFRHRDARAAIDWLVEALEGNLWSFGTNRP